MGLAEAVRQVRRSRDAFLLVPGPPDAGRAGPRAVFPLGFGRELEPQPMQRLRALVPAHPLHGVRQVAQLVPDPRTRCVAARIATYDSQPLTLGHLVLREEARIQSHLGDRRLVIEGLRIEVATVRVRPLRAHPEASRGDQHQHDARRLLQGELAVCVALRRIAAGQVRELPQA